jgi:hypothetical protein
MITHGISPKVLLPFLGGIAAGAVLLIVGIVAHDPVLKAAGSGVLLASAGHAGIGYVAPSGPVAVDAIAQDSPPVVASAVVVPQPSARKATKGRP